MAYQISTKAFNDVESFRTFLLERNSHDVSVAFLKSTYKKFRFLSDYPGVGKSRKELGVGVLSFPDVKYRRTIFYGKTAKGILIIRVLGGYQDHKSHFA